MGPRSCRGGRVRLRITLNFLSPQTLIHHSLENLNHQKYDFMIYQVFVPRSAAVKPDSREVRLTRMNTTNTPLRRYSVRGFTGTTMSSLRRLPSTHEIRRQGAISESRPAFWTEQGANIDQAIVGFLLTCTSVQVSIGTDRLPSQYLSLPPAYKPAPHLPYTLTLLLITHL